MVKPLTELKSVGVKMTSIVVANVNQKLSQGDVIKSNKWLWNTRAVNAILVVIPNVKKLWSFTT